MRILTLCCEYPPIGGGGATVCAALAKALVKGGHEVDVVTAGMAGLPARARLGGVEVHRVGGFRHSASYSTALEQSSFVLPMYRSARRLATRQGYDIIHCHFIVPTGLVAWLLRRSHGLPYVLTAHGSDVPGYNMDRFSQLHRLIAPGWRHVVRRAAAVTSPSRFLGGLLARQLPVAIDVIPNAMDPVVGGTAARVPGQILTVSRLVERKGVQFLLRALAGSELAVAPIVAGDGPYLPELRRQADALGVPIRFTGHMAREELSDLYAAAAIFVFPSLEENFPMVLLEAMSAGCAIVTTSAAGCAELVGEAAVLVPPGDVERLRREVLALTQDPARAAALGARARARARQFDANRVAGRYLELFRRVAGRGAPPSLPPTLYPPENRQEDVAADRVHDREA